VLNVYVKLAECAANLHHVNPVVAQCLHTDYYARLISAVACVILIMWLYVDLEAVKTWELCTMGNSLDCSVAL